MRFACNHLHIYTLLAAVSFAFGGCTSVRVQPVTADQKISHVCINENPRVLVGDFTEVMQEGFQKYGISSQVITGTAPTGCTYTSNYTARRTWDLAMYMTDAQIDILRDGRQIATANYHLKGGGGFSLTKWANTRSKILPVMDQLLAQVVRPSSFEAGQASVQLPTQPSQSVALPTAAAPQSELSRKLSNLKDAYDAGLITKEEYELKRTELITSL